MWIGHDEPIDNILIDMKQWSSESEIYLYKKNFKKSSQQKATG